MKYIVEKSSWMLWCTVFLSVLCLPVATIHAEQFVLCDQELTWNSGSNPGPTRLGPVNWSTPIPYAAGKIYVRYHAKSKPSNKLVAVQLCIWQDGIDLETCSGGFTFTSQGVYYANLGQPVSWWKKDGKDIDWTRSWGNMVFMHKDGSVGGKLLQSSACGAACYQGNDLHEHIPITYHVKAVVVAPGNVFVPPPGWTDTTQIDTTPPAVPPYFLSDDTVSARVGLPFGMRLQYENTIKGGIVAFKYLKRPLWVSTTGDSIHGIPPSAGTDTLVAVLRVNAVPYDTLALKIRVGVPQAVIEMPRVQLDAFKAGRMGFTVDASGPGILKVELYKWNGQKIWQLTQRRVSQAKGQFAVYPKFEGAGVYLVHVQCGDYKKVAKVVVLH